MRRACLITLAVAMVGAFLLLPVSISATDPILQDFDNPITFPTWLSGATGQILQYYGAYLGTPSASGQALLITGNNNTIGTGQGIGVYHEFVLPHPVYISTVTAWVYNSQANSSTFQLIEWDFETGVHITTWSAGGGGTGNRTLTLNRMISRKFWIAVHKSGFSGSSTIGIDNLQINVDVFLSPSPTPGASPTPNATPVGGGAPLAVACELLGGDANFNNFPGRWQIKAGDPFRPTGGGLFMPQSSQIEVQLSLNPNRLYRVTGSFKIAFPEILSGGEYWQIQLGGAAPFGIGYPTNASLQIFEITEARYEPDDQGNYFLTLTASDATEAGLVLENICVTEIRGVSSSSGGSVRADACQACDAPTSILDIFGIVGWLLCVIRNFFECLFIPFLVGIVSGILSVLALALSFAYWIVASVIVGIMWFVGIFFAVPVWVIAHIRNFAVMAGNDLQVGTSAALLNGIASNVRDMPTILGNGLSVLGEQFFVLIQNAESFFEVVIGLFAWFLQAIAYLITLVPLVISALVTGFNAAAVPLSGSPLCGAPGNFLYAPCLGFYILDNTIFSGPAFYLLPLVIGILVFDTFVWALSKFRGSFS